MFESVDKEDLRVALDDCVFNWRKGMWETHPLHWAFSRTRSIIVAFVEPTTLRRGVPS